jgi:hypothetical protein
VAGSKKENIEKSSGNLILPDDPEQFQRFVEAAREMGIEQVGEPYERAVDLILSRRKADLPAEPAESRPKRGRKKESPS